MNASPLHRVRDLFLDASWGIRLLFAGGVVAVLLALSAYVLLPSTVASKLQERAEAAGLTLRADGVHVGLSGVSIGAFSLALKDAPKPFLEGKGARVALSWSSVSQGARSALRGLSLDAAEVDLTVEELARLVDLRRTTRKAQDASAAERAEAAELPSVRVSQLNVRVRDAEGQLLKVQGLSLELSAEGFQSEVASLVVGSAPHDAAELSKLSASGVVVERMPVLRQSAAEAAMLTWESSAPGAERALGPSTLSRLLALRDALRGKVDANAGEPEADASSRKLWAEDARLDLRNMRVVEAVAEGTAPTILDNLDVSISADGAASVRVTGKGNAEGAGHVAWDLRATPSEARVEGQVSLKDVSLALFGPVLPPLPFSELEHTRVNADLALTGLGLESVAVKGSLALRHLAFASEGLAKAPVGPFDFAVEGEGTWTPARRELSATRAQIKTGPTTISLAGVLAWPKDGYRVDIVAELPKSRCADVLASVPSGLLDEYAAFLLGGTIGGKLTFHVDAANLDATKVDFDVKDACKFERVPEALDLKRFNRPFVHQVLEPDGTLFEMETGPGTIAWTPIEHVSPFFIQAVIAHEDGRFFTHNGFAEPEIGTALARNLKAKAFKFGASTITMQLVKNVFLHRDKLLARKVQEALIVWWLEQQWDKRRILELYLNVIEYGPSLYGIRDAALHYFGTLPIYLTPAQAGFLACVLPSPKSSHVHYEKKALSNSAKNRITHLLKHMAVRERIDAEALAYALEELENFRFYDPNQPPPVPPEIRGSAQKPPFRTSDVIVDPWEDYTPEPGRETGAFGQP